MLRDVKRLFFLCSRLLRGGFLRYRLLCYRLFRCGLLRGWFLRSCFLCGHLHFSFLLPLTIITPGEVLRDNWPRTPGRSSRAAWARRAALSGRKTRYSASVTASTLAFRPGGNVRNARMHKGAARPVRSCFCFPQRCDPDPNPPDPHPRAWRLKSPGCCPHGFVLHK
jgi:hypothetical protein